MKTRVIIILLTCWISTVQAESVENLDLEPCINGGVSATGNYPSQAAEDHALARSEVSKSEDLQLEPCVNGGVSALGRYPNQAQERVSNPSADGQ